MPRPLVSAVEGDEVVFRLADPRAEVGADAGAEVAGVRVWSDFDLGDTSCTRVRAGWQLRVPVGKLPPVDRLEYLFELTTRAGTRSVLDPGNPRLVAGAFGDHSVLELPGYRPPAWLRVEPSPGTRQAVTVGGVDVEIWSPDGTAPDEPCPLLLSHDGPEMDRLGGLTRFVGAMIAARRVAPLRVGLLAPGPRDERYAASPAYARTLCDVVVPAVLDLAPGDRRPVLMGQSLGGLAALHAEWTHPGTFAGLLLQSGSFFTPALDLQESGHANWLPITTFVAEVLAARAAPSRPPVGVCWGSAEENAANNQQLAAALSGLGVPASTGTVRDGHTFTCWRDLLDPHLTDVLTRAWES